MTDVRKSIEFGIGIMVIALSIRAIEHGQKWLLVVCILAGALGVGAIEKFWK